jgi:hypothetical protein
LGPTLIAALRGTKKKEFERAAEFERSKQPIKGTDKLTRTFPIAIPVVRFFPNAAKILSQGNNSVVRSQRNEKKREDREARRNPTWQILDSCILRISK